MNDEIGLTLKGMVACPLCGKEFIYVYSDAKGHSSIPCVKCGRIIMIDYESMAAAIIHPLKRRK